MSKLKKRFSGVWRSFLRLPGVVSLFSWLVILEVGIDNRITKEILKRRGVLRLAAAGISSGSDGRKRPVSTDKPRVLFAGLVRKQGSLSLCDNVIMNFDLCEPHASGRKFLFKEGFMRIGDRISPSRTGRLPRFSFSSWSRTQAPVPAVREFAPGKAAWIFAHPTKGNVALALRKIAEAVDIFRVAGVPADGGVLLSFTALSRKSEVASLLAKPFSVVPAKNLQGSFLFHRLIFGSGHVWYQSAAIASARRHLLTAFSVDPRSHSDDVGRITLVSRQDMQNGARYAPVCRKISNEDEIVAALQKNFPGVEIRKVVMEKLPMKEQLELIHRTDILIGMHGAALGFSMILPPNAGLLELFPASFRCPHWFNTFYLVIAGNGGHYRRWINLNPWREFSTKAWISRRSGKFGRGLAAGPLRDFSEVPPRAIVCRVKALQQKIRESARSWRTAPGS